MPKQLSLKLPKPKAAVKKPAKPTAKPSAMKSKSAMRRVAATRGC